MRTSQSQLIPALSGLIITTLTEQAEFITALYHFFVLHKLPSSVCGIEMLLNYLFWLCGKDIFPPEMPMHVYTATLCMAPQCTVQLK